MKTGATACGTCGRPTPTPNARSRRDTLRGNVSPSLARQEASPARLEARPLQWGLVFGGCFLVIGIVAFVVLRNSDAPELGAPTQAPVETPADRVANAKTFAQAIELARPAFTDTTDELGDGAKLLASYAVRKLRWDEVHVPAETSFARVAKDPQSERGKRLCATGEILRIARRDLEDRRVHVGRLRTTANDGVAFVAAGTTGDLVEGSTGTLCGVVLGMSGDAVSILGMFDLAENRMPLVEQ